MHSPFRYVPGLTVAYSGATNTRGSRWRAVIKRGEGSRDRFTASVPYADGPDAAAVAALARFNASLDGADWRIIGAALSLDGGTTYAYPVGPEHVRPVLSLPPV